MHVGRYGRQLDLGHLWLCDLGLRSPRVALVEDETPASET